MTKPHSRAEYDRNIREAYTDDFYVAYLRDPVGNKIAVFFNG